MSHAVKVAVGREVPPIDRHGIRQFFQAIPDICIEIWMSCLLGSSNNEPKVLTFSNASALASLPSNVETQRRSSTIGRTYLRETTIKSP